MYVGDAPVLRTSKLLLLRHKGRCVTELGTRRPGPGVIVELLCLPAQQVNTVTAQVGPAAPPQELARALRNISTKWPPRATLIVQINLEKPETASFFHDRLVTVPTIKTYMDSFGPAEHA